MKALTHPFLIYPFGYFKLHHWGGTTMFWRQNLSFFVCYTYKLSSVVSMSRLGTQPKLLLRPAYVQRRKLFVRFGDRLQHQRSLVPSLWTVRVLHLEHQYYALWRTLSIDLFSIFAISISSHWIWAERSILLKSIVLFSILPQDLLILLHLAESDSSHSPLKKLCLSLFKLTWWQAWICISLWDCPKTCIIHRWCVLLQLSVAKIYTLSQKPHLRRAITSNRICFPNLSFCVVVS